MGGSKQISKTKGTVYVFLSAVFFSLAGLLVKLIPWSSLSINAVRSIFAALVMVLYMAATHHTFVMSKAVVAGAFFNTVMSTTFVISTKLTTAANAIVLQFIEPIFVIFLVWIMFHKKPRKDAVLACIVSFAGIVCFFMDSLSGGQLAGNLIAIISGLSYAFVFLMKEFKNSDFESSILLSFLMNVAIGIWFVPKETNFSVSIWMYVIILGVVQYSISYIFLSKGLDVVSPVTASLTSMIEPILNPILVAVFYGETIGTISMIGAVLVICSSVSYTVRSAKE